MSALQKNISPWLASAIMMALIFAAAAYAILSRGFPVICYKDKQQSAPSPGGHNKAVSYWFNCRKEIAGLDFGPYSRPFTGIEFLATGESLDRHGMPPVNSVRWSRDNVDYHNKVTAPPVRMEWKSAAHLVIYHPPDSSGDGISFYHSYYIQFMKDPDLSDKRP